MLEEKYECYYCHREVDKIYLEKLKFEKFWQVRLVCEECAKKLLTDGKHEEGK